MKRFLSIITLLAMVFTLTPIGIFANESTAPVSFTDIDDTYYCAKAATALGQLEILKGYLDGSFGPEKSITRAEMSTVVCRMIQREEDAVYTVGETDFKDVDEEHWASGFINIAARHKIVNGYNNGEFRPENNVLYEEAIKMVVCAMGYDSEVVADPDDWSAPYIEVADKHGITEGLKGSKGYSATRGDVALMAYNAMDSESAHSKIPATPVPSVEGGKCKSGTPVKITSVTLGTDVYYTTDGSVPTVNSEKYTKPLVIKEATVIKAIAVKNGVVSNNVMTVEYTIK